MHMFIIVPVSHYVRCPKMITKLDFLEEKFKWYIVRMIQTQVVLCDDRFPNKF